MVVTLHSNFEFVRHIDYILRRVKDIYRAYQHAINATGGLTVKERILIYKQIIRLLIPYVFHILFEISSHKMDLFPPNSFPI